ncbi:MAG: hypothetical protein AABX75_02210, partial [Nanoarchaeota archaeon]
MPETEQKYPTIEQRLEEIRCQRGLSLNAFSISIGYRRKWYDGFLRNRGRGRQMCYSTVCNISERLELIPVLWR